MPVSTAITGTARSRGACADATTQAMHRTVLDSVIRTYYAQGMETELPAKCVFLYTWHEGTPEARKFWRTSPQHDVSSERFESGVTITACSICGHAAADY